MRPRFSKQEFARRGEQVFLGRIMQQIAPGHDRDYVAIDIETGEYEVDRNELAAFDRLLARLPRVQVWLRRVGSAYARKF